MKNYIDPTYKKLKPQISPFIKNYFFGNNRDPCKGNIQLAKFGTNASGILFSWRDNSS